MQAYQSHMRTTGQQVSNPVMKEMLIAFAVAEIDKIFESEGLDPIDRKKAHHLANEQGDGSEYHYERHHHEHHHHRHHPQE